MRIARGFGPRPPRPATGGRALVSPARPRRRRCPTATVAVVGGRSDAVRSVCARHAVVVLPSSPRSGRRRARARGRRRDACRRRDTSPRDRARRRLAVHRLLADRCAARPRPSGGRAVDGRGATRVAAALRALIDSRALRAASEGRAPRAAEADRQRREATSCCLTAARSSSISTTRSIRTAGISPSGFAAVAAHLEAHVRLRSRAARSGSCCAPHAGRREGASCRSASPRSGCPSGWRPVAASHSSPTTSRRSVCRGCPCACSTRCAPTAGDSASSRTDRRRCRSARSPRSDSSTRVDAVIYATEHGSGRGKPDAEPFRRNQPAPERAAVADRDRRRQRRMRHRGRPRRRHVRGALRRLAAATGCRQRGPPVVDRLSRVPDIARTLLEEASTRHAA